MTRSLFLFLSLFVLVLVSCQSGQTANTLPSETKTPITVDNRNISNANLVAKEDRLWPLGNDISANDIRKKPTDKIRTKVGVVEFNERQELICFRIENDELKVGDRILVVVFNYAKPQRSLAALIERKLESNCAAGDSDLGDSPERWTHYYALKLAQDDFEKSELIADIGALVNSKPARIIGGLVTFDLNGDGKNEYFRSCTSLEGVHLTVWTGKPLVGKRIWHSYYYLHYDTEPTCKKADWKGTDD